MTWLAVAALLIVTPHFASAQSRVLDDFDDLSRWTVIASDGVKASISPADCTSGRGLRLDYDFEAGAGYCIVRRQVDIALPRN